MVDRLAIAVLIAKSVVPVETWLVEEDKPAK
jgi:hypothetical protein